MLYLFDGSENGFLTAFLLAYNDDEALISSKTTQFLLGIEPVFVTTDDKKAEKAKARLALFDRHFANDLDLLLRCGEDDNEQVAFAYLHLLAQRKRPVRNILAEPAVYRAMEYAKKVRFEIHRFHGFIRFIECESGVLYAPFEPDNDICDLLVPHFRARLPRFPFVLHDVKRKKASVYDGENVFLAPLNKAEVLISADETAWANLWKRYYSAVNIPSRERLRQMIAFMPKRYHKYLPERNY